MLVYWQQLHKLVEGIWNKVQGIETINHEIYDKLDEIQVGWKVAEDIKIQALVPKKIIPIDCLRFTPISVIDEDEVLFYKRNSKLYKYQISTDTETEIGTTNVIGGVWRKSTNYYFFNGNNSIDIYNSSFVFQSSITCDMRPMYGAWVDTNKFFLKGKDFLSFQHGFKRAKKRINSQKACNLRLFSYVIDFLFFILTSIRTTL